MTVRNDQPRRNRPSGRSPLLLALLVGAVAWAGSAAAEDAPPPPPSPPLVRLFAPLKEEMSTLPPFLRDTDLKVHFRSYDFNREKPDRTENEAWAFGGWLAYRSGWLLDTFGIGATFYGSAPLYAPDDKDGTLLLMPGQEGYYVLGEAYAALRYQEYALLKGYRQLIDQTYINPQDNRMTPNTLEAVTLGGKAGPIEYLTGYVWKIKPRNSDTFVSMAEQAGAPGSDDGVVMAGLRATPVPGFKVSISEQYGIDTFNTVFGQADYTYPVAEELKLLLAGQYTDQRAVGGALLTSSAFKDWVTYNASAKVGLAYRDLTVTLGGSLTGPGNTIQSPWGTFPGYLSLIDQDFNRANEKAWLAGVAYDFSKLVTQGLSATFNFAWGVDAINPQTRADAPDQREYDLTFDYRSPWLRPAFLQGLWLRVRGAILEQEGADKLGAQVRVILNWERDLL